jgi:nucleoside-diphosphate-sugar epimerase
VRAVIAVTGASGFIGSGLVTRLAATGIAVVAVDRRPARRDVPGVRRVVADLADPLDDELLRGTLAAADVIVHLAGRPGVRDRSPGVELARHRDNVLTTEHVLAAAAGPVLVASSSSVYGGARGGRPCHEDDARRPLGGYARSKARAEDLCAEHRSAGAPVTVLRPFTVVGPGQRPDMALDRWLAAAVAGRPVEVFGSLQRSRDVTDIGAVVRAIAQLVELAATGRGLPPTLNLGTGTARTLGELVAAVRRAVPGPVDVVVTPHRDDDPDHTLADTTRCAATLGWVPTTDLDDVVAAQLGSLGAAA